MKFEVDLSEEELAALFRYLRKRLLIIKSGIDTAMPEDKVLRKVFVASGFADRMVKADD